MRTTFWNSLLIATALLTAMTTTALAAGGACPTSATYNDAVSTEKLHTLASLGVKSCFYASSRGSDANSGLDEAHPLLHLPGMTECAKNCAAIEPGPRDGFIVEGGSKYHFQGGGTPVGLPWNWRWSGGSDSPIYVGVDVNWYTGTAWARPVLTGGNPTSRELTVPTCAHPNDGMNFVTLRSAVKHVILDDFEVTGGCYSAPEGFVYFYTASSTHNTLMNIYAHGWTRGESCTGSGCGNSTAAFLSDNGPSVSPYNVWAFDVIDGSDTAGNIASGILWNCYDVHGSVIRYVANLLCNAHTFHDNWIDHTTEATFSGDHGNTFEENGSFVGYGPNSWYNNVVSHMNTAVGVWLNPQPNLSCMQGGCDYVFNNIIYAAGPAVPGNYFNIGDNAGPTGTMYIFNNTFADPNNGVILQCNARFDHPFVAANNHYITDSVSPYSSRCTGGSFQAELTMTHAAATLQGYTPRESFVLSPTLPSNATVRAGVNETNNFCSALHAQGETAAARACESDTAYACSYDTSKHRAVCPGRLRKARPNAQGVGWDIGAYQFTSSDAPFSAVPQ